MSIKSNLTSVALAILFAGCSSASVGSQRKAAHEETVPPGHVRILAEVVRIDSTLYGKSAADPCSKAPCIAWIAVKRIIGHGAGTAEVEQRDTLRAEFAFTLAPTTRQAFPKLKESLPGLSAGSLFIADIELLPEIGRMAHAERTYLIYSYIKTKQALKPIH